MAGRTVIFVIVAVAAMLAIVFGSTIGQGDYETTGVYFAVGFAILYVLYLYRFVWQFGLALTGLSVTFRPLGFDITSSHVVLGMIMVMIVVTMFLSPGKARVGVSSALGDAGSSSIPLMLIVLLCGYAALHLVWHTLAPFDGDYSWKHSFKRTVDFLAPLGLVAFFLRVPFRVPVSGRIDVVLLFMFLIGLAFNLGVAGYLYSMGIGITNEAADKEEGSMALMIPVIFASPNVFALRGIGPVSVFLGVALLSDYQWRTKAKILWKLAALFLFVGGALGCILSGGRASLLLAGIYVVFLAFYRRKVGILFAMGFMALLMVIFANLNQKWVNFEAPYMVSRSLQYLMLEKGDTWSGIENSTDWRSSLFYETLGEWRKSTKNFIIGRGYTRRLFSPRTPAKDSRKCS